VAQTSTLGRREKPCATDGADARLDTTITLKRFGHVVLSSIVVKRDCFEAGDIAQRNDLAIVDTCRVLAGMIHVAPVESSHAIRLVNRAVLIGVQVTANLHRILRRSACHEPRDPNQDRTRLNRLGCDHAPLRLINEDTD